MIYTWIKSFVATADYMNFTKAAAALHMTQSALSKQIFSLESSLELQLFNRDKKNDIHLTSEGKAFLPQARTLLEHTEKILTQARTINEE
jgi:DNA-binding transcriptional LysR family regulator